LETHPHASFLTSSNKPAVAWILLAPGISMQAGWWSCGSSDNRDAHRYVETLHLSFWDALVIQSALRLDCKQQLSEDLRRGK